MRAGIHISPLGDRVPRRGNWLTRTLGRTIVRLLGWRAEGEVPNHGKLVVIVAPHTTGWDFPIAIVTLIGLGVRISWLGVDWMFRYPLMRGMGGIPVNRQARLGVVPQCIEQFKTREQYLLGLSPEGSRKKVVPWKTGFYRIATKVGVPILMVTLDQKKKLIRVGPWFEPSGNYEADMEAHIRPVYAKYAEEYPDNFGM